MLELPEWTTDRRREIGAVIRQQRVSANLTQDEVTRRTGIDRRSLQRIEAGTSDPRLSRLLLIAAAIGVPLSQLVPETPEPER